MRTTRQHLVATGDLAPLGAQMPVSDVFDEAMDRAVRAFQQRRGLLVDGIVGPQTGAVLDGARWRLGDRILRHDPGHPMHGDDVARLQEQLHGMGVLVGRVDGIFGPQTEAAVRELQRGVGLDPDGTCGPYTLRALAQLSRIVRGGDAHGLREHTRLVAAGATPFRRTVVIDPAYGPGNPGTTRGRLHEADVVWDVAARVVGRLAAVGVGVGLTRGRHGCPDTVARVRFAEEVRADLLVSLHCDASTSPRPHGVASFYWGDDLLGVRSLVGSRLASLVQREITARTALLDCRSHPRTWTLLRTTSMPAVQVCLGYLTNREDARLLADTRVRDAIAGGVVTAVKRLYDPGGPPASCR